MQLTGTNRPRTYHKNATRPLCSSGATNTPLDRWCDTPGAPTTPVNTTDQHHQEGQLHRVTAAIAKGKRPVPSRTRKLSPSAPMVLHRPRCGRVGHRRTPFPERGPRPEVPFSVLCQGNGSRRSDVGRSECSRAPRNLAGVTSGMTCSGFGPDVLVVPRARKQEL